MLKVIIALLFLLALVSLVLGFVFLMRDQKGSTRLLTSLKFRVGFVALLLLLVAYGFWSGELVSHAPWRQIHNY